MLVKSLSLRMGNTSPREMEKESGNLGLEDWKDLEEIERSQRSGYHSSMVTS